MSDDFVQLVMARFDSGSPAEKVRLVRTLAAFLEKTQPEDDKADSDFALALANLDDVARYYEAQAQEARDDR